MQTNPNRKRIDSRLGELLLTVSEFAFEHCDDTQQAYELSRAMLLKLVKEACRGGINSDRYLPGTALLH